MMSLSTSARCSGRERNGEWPPGRTIGVVSGEERSRRGDRRFEAHDVVVTTEHDRGGHVRPTFERPRVSQRTAPLRAQARQRPVRRRIVAVVVEQRPAHCGGLEAAAPRVEEGVLLGGDELVGEGRGFAHRYRRAGERRHCVQENESTDVPRRRDQRDDEATEGVTHEDDVAVVVVAVRHRLDAPRSRTRRSSRRDRRWADRRERVVTTMTPTPPAGDPNTILRDSRRAPERKSPSKVISSCRRRVSRQRVRSRTRRRRGRGPACRATRVSPARRRHPRCRGEAGSRATWGTTSWRRRGSP